MIFLGSDVKHSLNTITEQMKMLFIILNIKLFPKVTRSILQLGDFPLLTDGAIKKYQITQSLVRKRILQISAMSS